MFRFSHYFRVGNASRAFSEVRDYAEIRCVIS